GARPVRVAEDERPRVQPGGSAASAGRGPGESVSGFRGAARQDRHLPNSAGGGRPYTRHVRGLARRGAGSAAGRGTARTEAASGRRGPRRPDRAQRGRAGGGAVRPPRARVRPALPRASGPRSQDLRDRWPAVRGEEGLSPPDRSGETRGALRAHARAARHRAPLRSGVRHRPVRRRHRRKRREAVRRRHVQHARVQGCPGRAGRSGGVLLQGGAARHPGRPDGHPKDALASARRSVVRFAVVPGTTGRAVLVVAATVLSAGPLAAGEPTCVVAYDADLVTVHAKRAPLADVVREIGRRSGAEIVGDVRKPRDVSQDFERVPLVDALARLLREQNFTLRYGPEGKLRTIGLLGEPQALAAAKTTPADAGNPDKPASARRHRHRGVQSSRETLPDGQVLVTVAGTDTGGATNPRDA